MSRELHAKWQLWPALVPNWCALRSTVPEAADAVPRIKERLAQMRVSVPIVSDFHYNGHTLLTDYPGCAEALDKYRINPGNVSFENKARSAVHPNRREWRSSTTSRCASASVGVRWIRSCSDKIDGRKFPLRVAPIGRARSHAGTMVQSALLSARRAEEIGSGAEPHHSVGEGVGGAGSDRRSIPSWRAASTTPCISVLTEAGMRLEGYRCLVGRDGCLAATGHWRHRARVADAGAEWRSHAGSSGRAGIAADDGPAHLRAAGRGVPRLRPHRHRRRSRSWRGDIQGFIRTSMPEWKTRYPGVETLNVAVMGCIVNGPGESKHADIGISLPGTGETPTAPVFVDGKKVATLRGPTLTTGFQADGGRLYRAPLRHRFANGCRRESKAIPDWVFSAWCWRCSPARFISLPLLIVRKRRWSRSRRPTENTRRCGSRCTAKSRSRFASTPSPFSLGLSGQFRRQQQRLPGLWRALRARSGQARRFAEDRMATANNKVRSLIRPEPGVGKAPRLKDPRCRCSSISIIVKVE